MRWPARLTRLKRGPLVEPTIHRLPQAQLWLDGGHNEAAAIALATWLTTSKAAPQNAPRHIILGMLASKAHVAYLTALAKTGAHIHAVPIKGNDNALTPAQLVEAAQEAGLTASAHDTIAQALNSINNQDALILIAGSLYLAGEVLAENA